MAAPKRTTIQIERDRREIADLYLQGWTQSRIAEHLNNSEERDYTLSQQMISYDLKRIQEQWRESALIDINEVKIRELAKVDRLEREYWQAWVRSCEDAETIRREEKAGDAERIITTRKGQAGDPRFLNGVQWCIEQRCKIIGIEAAIKFEHSVSFDVDEWRRKRQERLERAGEESDDQN